MPMVEMEKLSPKGCSKPKSFSFTCYSAKATALVSLTVVLLFVLFDIQVLRTSLSSPSSNSWSLQHWMKVFGSTNHHQNCTLEHDTMSSKLRDSVTFLPLKDLRFTETAMEGNTWFMSSLDDTEDGDGMEYLYFPSQSQASKGRLLCFKGLHTSDGTKNFYGLAWPESLPANATLLGGLTYISDTYYDYINPCHSVSAMVPFVGWYKKNGCQRHDRWVLFHWGELRTGMGSWLHKLMEATFGDVKVEGFEGGTNDQVFCFEKALVMRQNMRNMKRDKRHEVFDLLRCKARISCDVRPMDKAAVVNGRSVPVIRLTLLMRKGARSFKNESAVINIFKRECESAEGCKLTVAHSDNHLSFCDQVSLMSSTDILVSPHGAQLTNMFFMDRNSSVMEFFPKGWLELAGVGKYVYHWMADHSGMRHQGAWWESDGGTECHYPKDDPRCFLEYKDAQVGHNETYFADWARNVINQVRISKLDEVSKSLNTEYQLSYMCM